MAQHYSDQYASINDVVRQGLLTAHELGGSVRVAQFTFSNAGHVENDTVLLTRLPTNSTAILIVVSTDTLNTGNCDIGTVANPVLFLSNIGLIQTAQFFADPASGVLTHFDIETDIVLRWRSATVSGTIKGYLLFV